MDSLSWVALGAAVTVAGLLVSFLVWSRRGPGRGLRAVAWSLLPLAAGLTGLLRLAAEIVESVGEWAVRLVFSPTVWLGVVVAGVAVLCWVVGGVVLARSRRKDGGPSSAAVPGTRRQVGPAPARGGKGAPVDEDQDDIEAILRKHGIS